MPSKLSHAVDEGTQKPVRFIHEHMPAGALLGGSGSAVEGAEEAEGEAEAAAAAPTPLARGQRREEKWGEQEVRRLFGGENLCCRKELNARHSRVRRRRGQRRNYEKDREHFSMR